MAKEQFSECKVTIESAFDKKALPQYQALKDAFAKLIACNKIWDVTARQSVDTIRERSYASTSVTRESVTFQFDQLDFVTSEFPGFRFANANGNDMFLFPAFLIVLAPPLDFALVSLADLDITCNIIRFVEEEPIPRDAEIVGKTWHHVNKNGSRDNRFSNNYESPIVRYAEIIFTSEQGLNEAYHFSNANAAIDFVKAYAAYLIVVSGDAPPRIENNLPSEPQPELSKVKAFEILGLPADATQQDIQKAYRDLIKKYHPDKVSHLGEEFRVIAEKKTTEINQAYELLTS